MESPIPDDDLQLFNELLVIIYDPTTVRLSLGTAPCGPARGVVWGGGVKISPLPD